MKLGNVPFIETSIPDSHGEAGTARSAFFNLCESVPYRTMYLHICRDGDENTIEQEVDMKYLALLLTVVLCLPGPSALAQYRVPHGVFG